MCIWISAFCSLLVSYMPLALRVVRLPQTHYGGGLPRAPLLKSPHPGVWWSPGAVARIRARSRSNIHEVKPHPSLWETMTGLWRGKGKKSLINAAIYLETHE